MNGNDLGKLPDRQLLADLRAFNNEAATAPTTYGLTAAKATALTGLLDKFEASLDALDLLRNQETAKQTEKDQDRKDVVAEARNQFNVIQSDNAVTNQQRSKVGLDIRDTTRTPSPSPSSAPFALIDFGKLKHTINFRDAATPNSAAKPKGMLGAEIWRFIGTAPPSAESDYQFVALDTATPYTSYFTMADAGKTVYYLLRWQSKNGDKGEWSEVVQATING